MKSLELNPVDKIASLDIMTEQTPAPRQNSMRRTIAESRKRRTVMLGLGLALMLPLSFTALDYLVPKSPISGQSAFTRAGWYLRSGQWKANVRTLVCALDYVMASDAEIPLTRESSATQLSAPSKTGSTHAAGA